MKEAAPTEAERAEWATWDQEAPCEEGGGADAIGHAGAEVSLRFFFISLKPRVE